MPRAAPEGTRLGPFFAGLRGQILSAWRSGPGYAYDRVIYSVSYPYSEQDIRRVLEWCGRPEERRHLPDVDQLNRTLESADYPGLGGMAPPGVSARAWSAILHFCDPSYPLYSQEALEGLRALGARLGPKGADAPYPEFLEAVDRLKVAAPVSSIPETNWYLARNIGVGLEGWWNANAVTAPPAHGVGGRR